MKSPALPVRWAVVGILFGSLISALQMYAAHAAVAVRPNLADVGYGQAMLTGHGGDWLFYHYPAISGVVTALACGVGFFLLAGVLSE